MNHLASLVAWMISELILTAALAALYVILRRFAHNPADRYLFLRLSFAVVLLLPLLPVQQIITNVASSHAPVSPLNTASVSIQVNSKEAVTSYAFMTPFLLGIAGAYVLAVAMMFGRIFASSIKLKALAGSATLMGLRNGVPVLSTDAKVPPATFGWLRPVILIPHTILSEISADEFDMILVHEEQHIQRRDYLFNLLRAVVQAVLVFSPWIYWLGNRLIEDMELSCDELTVQAKRCSARSYGNMLFRLGIHSSPRTDLMFSGLFVSQSFLSRRIAAMKEFGKGRNRMVPMCGFACLTLLLTPALVAMGIEGQVASTVSSSLATPSEGTYAYRVISKRQELATEIASGVLQLVDGVPNKIQDGRIFLTLIPTKQGAKWNVDIEGYDTERKEPIMEGKLIIDSWGGGIESRYDQSERTGISISLSPPANIQVHSAKPMIKEPDVRFYLQFKQPTDLKDLIRPLAEITGKSVILDRNVQGQIAFIHDRPITKLEAYETFLEALHILDLDVIETSESIKIVRK